MTTEFERRTHLFQDIDPEAECPVCGFPSWSHDPATAYFYMSRVTSDGTPHEHRYGSFGGEPPLSCGVCGRPKP